MIRGTNRSCVNRHVRYAAVRVSEKRGRAGQLQKPVSVFYVDYQVPT